MKSISVIIPNYNGRDLLERNLPFVYRALESSEVTEFEIIIPDDASRDTSVDFLQTNYPDVNVIINTKNKGFGGNSNVGIFNSTKDLVYLLNSDVELTDGFFTPLMSYFNQPDTFGVTTRIIGLVTDEIQDGAKYPDYNFGHIGSTLNYRSDDKSALYTLFLHGGNALMDRKKLVELGGFDEIFNPYYAEDVDLGLRAWKVGYKCYYDDTAICRHPLSGTISKEQPKKVKIISKRNKIYLHFIHLEMPESVYFLIITTLKTFLRAMMLNSVYVHAYIAFIKTIPQCIQSRKRMKYLQISKNISISMRDIRTFIKKSIDTTPSTKF